MSCDAALIFDDFNDNQSGPILAINPLGDTNVTANRNLLITDGGGGVAGSPASVLTVSGGSLTGSINPDETLEVTWNAFDGSPSTPLDPDLFGQNKNIILENVGFGAIKFPQSATLVALDIIFEVFAVTSPAITNGTLGTPVPVLRGTAQITDSVIDFAPTPYATVSIILSEVGGPLAADSTLAARLRFANPNNSTGTFSPSEISGASITIGSIAMAAVPEPSSFLLAGIGLAVLGGVRYRRRKLAVVNS